VGRLHFGSFDAERRWRPDRLARLPSAPINKADRITPAMDQVLCAGCAPGDVLATARPMSPALIEALSAAQLGCETVNVPGPGELPVEERFADQAGAPWGPRCPPLTPAPYAVVPRTGDALARHGIPASLPGIGDVARVNSKTFSNHLVDELGLCGGAVVARSPGRLRTLCADLGARGERVLVKDPYGVSGRDTLVIDAPRVLDTVVRVLERQVGQGKEVELLVQPLFRVAKSFSGHLLIDRAGALTLLGSQATVNDGFAFAGSAPAPAWLERATDRAGYPDLLAALGKSLFREGYHGPVCVDSALLEDGRIVPVLEINARVSMGLLNLTLAGNLADRAVRTRVRVRQVSVDDGDPATRLLGALRNARLLWPGHGPGIMPLASGTLVPPRGRLFYAAFAAQDAEFDALETSLDRLLPPAGRPI
jgi:hypothetical protein